MPTVKEWEGGTATCLAPTVFKLNPDLDPFKGDLLQTKVIQPIEEELNLLAEQIHKASEEEPELEPVMEHSFSLYLFSAYYVIRSRHLART